MPDLPAAPMRYPCPACSCCGFQDTWACCGNAQGNECCGDPELVPYPCPWCQATGSATSEDILRYAEASGDMLAYAQHEANLMLDAVLLDHPARKKPPSL